MFFARRDLVFRLIKISSLFYKLHAGRRIRAKFHAYRPSNSRDMVAGEKKEKKDKSAEKHNITVIFCIRKNGNIKKY
jgi:hypothetical protein